ncbi:hypothetical protein ACFVWG_14780 [Kribbella sp. NPDC058245]|uniref:hypothetical protein n=1 Tax=Kribbella sp. NPDC058245 TaxID=3346399 RepID=UPI0036EC6843
MKGLVAAVAAVTVGAVVLGATIAARRGPEDQSLSAPPAPLSPGPTKITLSVPGLAQGDTPRIPYLVGREVRGGGDPVPVPGVEDILEFTRVGGAVLAVTTTDVDGSRVQRLNAGGAAVVQGADHLVANEDHSAAAYAAYQGGTSPTEGGIVFADTGTALQSLKLSKGWNFRVLAYAGGKVYYQSSDVLGSGATWSTYAWTPGQPSAVLAPTIPSLTALTADGKTAASTLVTNDAGSCSAISSVDTGQRAWKTCGYGLTAFTPNGSTVFGAPTNDQSSCISATAALDASTGKLRHEWRGCVLGAAPEDDDHLLMVAAVSAADTTRPTAAIVRCTIITGACELAAPTTKDHLLLSR